MVSYISSFFSTADYIPHGLCLAWQPELIALHVGSDAAIAIAYYSIPFALIYFVWKRADFMFPSIFLLSGAFILACGTTHAMSIVTLWQPDYWLEGIVKLVTALVSVTSAIALWQTMPLALALPSMAQLEQANSSLAGEIAERKRAQAALGDMNAELERRVTLRTAELQDEVAQRRRSEDALRQSEMYLAEAQKLSHTGSFLWHIATGKIIWSEETFRIFEIDPTTVPSLELALQGVHPDDRAVYEKFVDEVASQERDWTYEYRLLMPDGRIKHLRVSAHAGSDRLERVGAVMDVSAVKKAEDETLQARSELARVARVTALGELTAAIAHEVNQPLTGLVSRGNACLRWLNGETPNLEAAQLSVQRMIADSVRAGEVITRIQAMVSKSAPRKERLGINDVVRDVVVLVRSEVQQNSVSLRTELSDRLPDVAGDRVQLQQVVLNLILNASEAVRTIHDGPREVIVRSVTGEAGKVLVSVDDSGPGLAPGKFEEVFQAFYTTKTDGMGMGLAISRSIIEAFGGQLWAEPNSPRGAKFQFSLPTADDVNTGQKM
jgi:C4-dicarboxylate-specific signal transduction histidine kinase